MVITGSYKAKKIKYKLDWIMSLLTVNININNKVLNQRVHIKLIRNIPPSFCWEDERLLIAHTYFTILN